MHVHPDLVDDVGVEERARELAAAHETDSFPRALLEVAHERAGFATHELRTICVERRERPGEDVAPDLRRLFSAARSPHAKRLIPSLSPPEDRVDRLPVVAHDLAHIAAGMQPVDLATASGDEAIEATRRPIRHRSHRTLLCEGHRDTKFPFRIDSI